MVNESCPQATQSVSKAGREGGREGGRAGGRGRHLKLKLAVEAGDFAPFEHVPDLVELVEEFHIGGFGRGRGGGREALLEPVDVGLGVGEEGEELVLALDLHVLVAVVRVLGVEVQVAGGTGGREGGGEVKKAGRTSGHPFPSFPPSLLPPLPPLTPGRPSSFSSSASACGPRAG